MSYSELEVSTEDGRTVSLYFLLWGKTEWRYTSADHNIQRTETDANGNPEVVTYLAVAINDNGMVQGGSSSNDFTVDCPTNLPIVDLFRGTPPSETIWMTVRRIQYDDPDEEALIWWDGTVSNVVRTDLANAQIMGQPLTASFERSGLRLCWTRECPHFLYDFNCRVDPEQYRVNATVIALTGNSATYQLAAGKPAIEEQYFRGGFLSWDANADGTKERRMVEDHTGTTVRVFGLTDGLAVGQTVAMYPGCDRTHEMCDTRFDNTDNYGGFKNMPGTSPFGTSIF